MPMIRFYTQARSIRKRKLSIFSILLLLAQTVIAQPKRVESSKNPGESNAVQTLQTKHSLTIGVPSFFDGFTALTYERRINTRFTIAAAVGVTYNSYFMQVRDQRLRDEAYSGGSVRTGPNTFDVEEEFNNRFYHEAKPGIYLALTPKIYFNRKAIDGFYIAPMLEFRDYRFRTFKGNESVFYAPYLSGLSEKGVATCTGRGYRNVSVLRLLRDRRRSPSDA